MADCRGQKDELLHDDARVQHIATVSSTLLQHSGKALLATLQQDAAARQCLTRFLAGSGERRRAPAACLRPRTPCSRTLAHHRRVLSVAGLLGEGGLKTGGSQ